MAKKRLSDQVMVDIQSMIAKNYKPGDRLPPENELVQMFSVSRMTVREAISKLSAVGIVDVRQGDGTFVKKISPVSLVPMVLPMLSLSDINMSDVFDVRILIECHAAELAASHATKQELKELRNLLEQMDQAVLDNEIQQYNEWDLEFHKCIAKSSGNSIISMICELITEMIRESISQSCQTAEHTVSSIIYHNHILQAISKHDGAKAALIMRDHLSSGLSFVLEHRNASAEKAACNQE